METAASDLRMTSAGICFTQIVSKIQVRYRRSGETGVGVKRDGRDRMLENGRTRMPEEQRTVETSILEG